MHKLSVQLAFLFVVAVIGVAIYGFGFVPKTATAETSVRWLLAHQPGSLYEQALRVFGDTLSRESHGRLQLSILTPENIGVSGDVPHARVLELLASGETELSSSLAVANGEQHPAFRILGLPFLFDDYESIAATLDGSTGQALLDDLSANTDITALAYTLSGGFRIIASPEPLHGMGDLVGKKIATSGGPVAEATLRSFGAVPVAMDDTLDMTDVDAVETTYTRIGGILEKNPVFAAHILETNHSLFLTTIIAGDSFYNSLSSEDRKALNTAASAAARQERTDSIARAGATKQQLLDTGSVITPVSAAEHAALIMQSAVVYDTFATFFDQSILADIRNEQR